MLPEQWLRCVVGCHQTCYRVSLAKASLSAYSVLRCGVLVRVELPAIGVWQISRGIRQQLRMSYI